MPRVPRGEQMLRGPGRSRCRRRDGSGRGGGRPARRLAAPRGPRSPRRRSGSRRARTGRRHSARARSVAGRAGSGRAAVSSRLPGCGVFCWSRAHQDAHFLACTHDCDRYLFESRVGAHRLWDDHHVDPALPADRAGDHEQLPLHPVPHHGTADSATDREAHSSLGCLRSSRHCCQQRVPRTPPGPHGCREVLATPQPIGNTPGIGRSLRGWGVRALCHVTPPASFDAREREGR